MGAISMNADEIRGVTFDRTMRGYRPEEVDELLAINFRKKKKTPNRRCSFWPKRWTSTAMMKKR
mgnify:CR=1 FL=1